MWRSYRWRRRLAWSAGGALFLAGLTAAAIALPKDHGKRYQLAPTGTEPPQQVEGVRKQVRVTEAQRREVNRTLVAFVRLGVTRSDPAAAWDRATPAMRSVVTRKEWNGGALPVAPFPAQISDDPTWRVLTSYRGDLTIDLVLQPRPDSGQGPIAFAVELKKNKEGRWLVDSMVPEHIFGPSAPPSATPRPVTVPNGKDLRGVLSPLWFILPALLLGLAVLVPTLIALNVWRRHRAIERRYRRERSL